MASSKTNKKTAQAKTDQASSSKSVAKATASNKVSKATEPAKKKDAKKAGKPGLIARASAYFKNVRTELKRVVWPTKSDLVKYTGAVVGMLVFFGLMIAIVDAVIVPVLYAFSGLR